MSNLAKHRPPLDSRNQRLFELWSKYADVCRITRAPMPVPKLKSDCLLFVGFNPSWTLLEERLFTEAFRGRAEAQHYPSNDVSWFVSWANAKNDFVGYIAQTSDLQAKCLASKRFNIFNKFDAVARQAMLPSQHIDIAFFRETRQAWMRARQKEWQGFWIGQLELFWEALDLANPRVVIIASRGAAKVLRRDFGSRFEGADGGHQFIRSLAGGLMPVLFKPYPGNGWQRFWNVESVAREVRSALESA